MEIDPEGLKKRNEKKEFCRFLKVFLENYKIQHEKQVTKNLRSLDKTLMGRQKGEGKEGEKKEEVYFLIKETKEKKESERHNSDLEEDNPVDAQPFVGEVEEELEEPGKIEPGMIRCGIGK